MKNGPYELIIPPDGYPGKLYRGRYAYEHHVIFWQHTGYTIKKGEVIHHKDGNKRHNVYENLELKTNEEHKREHSTTGRTMVDLICPICYTEFTKERRQTHLVKKNCKFTCCSRSCSAKLSNIKNKENLEQIILNVYII